MNRNAPPFQSTVQPSDQPSNHPTSQPTNPPASLRYSVTLRSIVAQDSARCGEGKITEARNRGRYPTEPFRSNGVSLQCTRRPQNNNCFIGNTEYTQRTAVNCAHVRLLSLSLLFHSFSSPPPLPFRARASTCVSSRNPRKTRASTYWHVFKTLEQADG